MDFPRYFWSSSFVVDANLVLSCCPADLRDVSSQYRGDHHFEEHLLKGYWSSLASSFVSSNHLGLYPGLCEGRIKPPVRP